MFLCNVVSPLAQLVSFLCWMFKNYHGWWFEDPNYKIEVQLKPKLHQLWRIASWLGKLQLRIFLTIVWVFLLERVVPPLVIAFEYCYWHFVIKSPATCRPKSRCQSNLTTLTVLANRSLHQDLMHSGCCETTVPNVCLQAFSLFPLPSSPLDQRPVHRLTLSAQRSQKFATMKFNPWRQFLFIYLFISTNNKLNTSKKWQKREKLQNKNETKPKTKKTKKKNIWSFFRFSLPTLSFPLFFSLSKRAQSKPNKTKKRCREDIYI